MHNMHNGQNEKKPSYGQPGCRIARKNSVSDCRGVRDAIKVGKPQLLPTPSLLNEGSSSLCRVGQKVSIVSFLLRWL